MSPNPKKKKLSEAEVQKPIRTYLDHIGAFHVRHMAGAIVRNGKIVARTIKGHSDIIACVPYTLKELESFGLTSVGVFTAIETKPEGWKPPGYMTSKWDYHKSQADFIQDVIRAKGFGLFANSVDSFLDNLQLRSRFLF